MCEKIHECRKVTIYLTIRYYSSEGKNKCRCFLRVTSLLLHLKPFLRIFLPPPCYLVFSFVLFLNSFLTSPKSPLLVTAPSYSFLLCPVLPLPSAYFFSASLLFSYHPLLSLLSTFSPLLRSVSVSLFFSQTLDIYRSFCWILPNLKNYIKPCSFPQARNVTMTQK